MSKKRLRAMEPLEEVSHYADDVRYELLEPVGGALDIRGAMVSGSEEWFGETIGVEAGVIPLDEVEISTENQMVEDSSVRISGKAAVSVGSFMTEDHLPPGRYLLRVKLRGSGNWDRQTLYFTVAE